MIHPETKRWVIGAINAMACAVVLVACVYIILMAGVALGA